ncbi:putative nucleolar, Nop52 [Helianthus annuus]|uniref:Nucleolar, Nop52 n=1 Tax=Helianthus annuus TaxID=4232 RepID=A0A251SS27_HELAN|nr:ribosomal RNA processing protein 1 homolog [Helianthus annuus]KAF5773233.1 putative nucleolar, Nop52 [Helianthus annuus]KAJ0858065.1 putative nucleolar, Nop52 [Helianthus annuus]
MAVEQSTTTTTTTDPPTAITQPQSLPLIRNLASCNTAARSKALRELTSWLPTQPQISDDEMKKLWKGLFYCIWHADKAPVQSNLINKLSSMLLTLDVPLSLHYLSVFFTTVRREWSGIDVLRLDKFYLLIRRFVNSSFKLMKKYDWNLDLCRRVVNVFEEKCLLASEKKFLGNGVNYHIASVFLDELNGYLPVSGQEVYQVFEILFKPLLRVMSVSEDKVLVGKIKSNVFERLLCMGKSLIAKKKSGGEGEGEEDSEVVNLGTIALKMGFASKFYDLGSGSECFQGNRKVLFGLNKEFLKLEKELEASGVDVKFPTVEGDDGDEEVPDLVPIVGNETQNSSVLLLEGSKSVAEGSKKSSKKKKKKKGAKEGLDSEKQETGKENDDANMITANGESASNGVASDTNDVSFTELFKSNLQKEFEKVAEEDGLDKDGESSLHEDLSTITISSTKVSKKRKRVKSVEARGANNGDNTEQGGTAMKSGGEKSAKKVRFSKNNLVWKPQSPLPPQSLRIPPSVTPRGSALKKGVPPGPIREMPPAVKKAKKKKAKVRKVMKTTSPAMKRLRKLQTLST